MPKKSKSVKSTSQINDDSKHAAYEELIAKDPQFHKGSSKFQFPNGDEYEGEFCAHSNGVVWRQGKGTYKTNDGQIYAGHWDADKLDETKDVEILYPDGTKFMGRLSKGKYSGPGIYQIEENVSFICNFAENKPNGDISMVDPNEKLWHGIAEKDDSLLVPEHAFYRNINPVLGIGRRRKKKPTSTTSASKVSLNSIQKSESKSLKYSDVREAEKRIFAKTKKTPSDIQTDPSEWYQEYENFKSAFGPIVCKARTDGETFLTPDEYEWYQNYKEFERKCLENFHNTKNKTKKALPDNKWFELIHSKEYKVNNKPVSVFYSAEDSDECDSTCQC